jgi:hypothetical protein
MNGQCENHSCGGAGGKRKVRCDIRGIESTGIVNNFFIFRLLGK